MIPAGDLIQHERSADCICGPTTIPVVNGIGVTSWVVVHHSLDGREFEER